MPGVPREIESLRFAHVRVGDVADKHSSQIEVRPIGPCSVRVDVRAMIGLDDGGAPVGVRGVGRDTLWHWMAS